MYERTTDKEYRIEKYSQYSNKSMSLARYFREQFLRKVTEMKASVVVEGTHEVYEFAVGGNEQSAIEEYGQKIEFCY